MRISHVLTQNIGGLVDCDVALPDQQQLAIAGANGTGKSKLLACLLVPWTRTKLAGDRADWLQTPWCSFFGNVR